MSIMLRAGIGFPSIAARLATAWLAVLPPAAVATAQDPPVHVTLDLAALEATAQRHLDALRSQRGFPGASAAFVLPDSRIGAVATGSEDTDGGQRLTTQHKFLSGSIGKTYCAAVALQLVGAGKLALDGKVATVLGDCDWYARVPNAATITLRQLLSHTSGIPDHVWKKEFEQRVLAEPDRPPTPVECVGYILGDAPLAEPGAKWSYADTNFVLVGLMIEAVAQQPFYDVLRARVLAPLALADTLPSDRRELPGLSNGHSSGIAFHRGDTVREGRYFVNPAFEYCGGGLCSTPRDLARWGRALFVGDVVPASLRADHLRAVPAEKRITDGYGLGCFVMESKFGTALGHSGFMPGYQAMLAHYPDLALTIAIMWNTDDGRQVGNPRRAAEELAGVLQQEIAATKK